MSEHVVLETDVDAADARGKIEAFERMHQTLARAMKAAPNKSGPRVEVVLFSDLAEFYRFAGKNRTSGGYFLRWAPGDIEPRPVMVMPDVEVADETRWVFQHELAHRFIAQRFVSVPRWLNEGLAEYFSSVEARPDGLLIGASPERDFWTQPFSALVWVGQAQQINMPVYLAPKATTIAQMSDEAFYAATAKKEGEEVTTKDRERQSANYTGAWRLVHFLLQEAPAEDRARFAAYLGALERGEKDALMAHVGDDREGFDARFAAYLTEAPTRVVVPASPSSPGSDVHVVDLEDADVHVLWSRLAPGDTHRQGEAEKAVESDLSSAAARHQAAAVLLQAGRFDEAKTHLDRALTLSPHDPRCLFTEIVLAERMHAPVSGATIDELARTATSAAELAMAASYVGSRRLPYALLLSARALAADPLCWTCERVRAKLLARAGATEDAIVAVDRAITLAPEGTRVADLARYRAELVARLAK